MRVTFWGVRGSIPTPGPATVRYGGNTSCVEVRLADGTIVILDGGTGIRELGRRLIAEGEHAAPLHLLITHVHWDHLIGVPFFAPIYSRACTLVLHPVAVEGGAAHEDLFDGLHFPLRLHQLPSNVVRPTEQPGAWRIGSARVTRARLNHPGGSTGFRIDDADGSSVVLLTDNELEPPGAKVASVDELARFSAGCGLLIHDAQYLDDEMAEKRGWGHSTIPQVLDLGRRAEARRLALYHHDPDRHDDALDAIADAAQRWWATHARAGEVFVASEQRTIEVVPG